MPEKFQPCVRGEHTPRSVKLAMMQYLVLRVLQIKKRFLKNVFKECIDPIKEESYLEGFKKFRF